MYDSSANRRWTVRARWGGGGGGGGLTQIWKWYICATEGLKIRVGGGGGGLKERSLTENGGFQNWPTREKRGFGAKITKNKNITVLKRMIFSSSTGRKCGAKTKHGRFPVTHTRTVPIWESPPPPAPHPHREWEAYPVIPPTRSGRSRDADQNELRTT